MKGKAIPFLVVAGLCIATCAMALDLSKRAGSLAGRSDGFTIDAVYSCDNGVTSSAYFQDDNGRYGNVFNFPAGSQLRTLSFVHHGFGFPGPYSYDLELWDRATCTYIGGVNGLSAANAATTIEQEVEELCNRNLVVAGNVIVAIDANTCAVPSDCYPDVVFDDQVGSACPYVVDVPGGVCINLNGPADGGAFLLDVVTNDCPTDVKPASWGRVKVLYR